MFYFLILSFHHIKDRIFKLVLNALNAASIFPYRNLQSIRNDLPPGVNALRTCSCIMKHRVSDQLTLGRRDVDYSYA